MTESVSRLCIAVDDSLRDWDLTDFEAAFFEAIEQVGLDGFRSLLLKAVNDALYLLPAEDMATGDALGADKAFPVAALAFDSELFAAAIRAG